MTDTDLEIIVFVLLAVAIGVYVCVSSSIKRKKAAENAIKKAWGKRAVYKGTDESFETGEGLEKKQEDFAAEVAAQMNA